MMEGLVVMFIEGEQIRIRNIDNHPAPGRRTDDTDIWYKWYKSYNIRKFILDFAFIQIVKPWIELDGEQIKWFNLDGNLHSAQSPL